MKIKLLTGIAGAYVFSKGAIADTAVHNIDEAECRRLVAAGLAEVVGKAPAKTAKKPAASKGKK